MSIKNNAKKLILAAGLSLMTLTGCSNKDIKLNLQSFNLNFRYFLLPNTQSVEAIKVDSIDLTQDNVTLKDLEVVDGMIYDMYSTCGDKEFYINNFENSNVFYEKVKKYINSDSYTKFVKDGIFKESLDNIYENSGVEFYDTEIISLNLKNKEKYYEAEVICVGNNASFLIEYINVYVDEDNKITRIDLLDELQEYSNTTKPLSADSLLNEDNIHKDFYNEFTDLKSRLTNSALFEKYNLAMSNDILMTDEDSELTQEEIDSQKYKDEINLQVNSLISSLNSDLDSEALKTFFVMGEGAFTNTFVTEYKIEDYEGLALSYYTVKSVSNGNVETFIFTFDRIENKITNIAVEGMEES